MERNMSEYSPYNLEPETEKDANFYADLRIAADEIYICADDTLGEIIDDYSNFITHRKAEKLRYKREYLIEAIMIGVLWNRYVCNALALNRAIAQIGALLYQARQRNRTLKPNIDKVRGFLAGRFFIEKRPCRPDFNLYNFKRLLYWLEATGDFREEAKRLRLWEAYFESRESEYSESTIKSCAAFSYKFVQLGDRYLGKYLENTHKFIVDNFDKYANREDLILCRRTKEEYLLNMVGAQFLNDAYRDEFLNAKKTVVLAPTCMRAKNADCKAKYDEDGNICVGCNKNCNIGKLHSEFNNKAKIALIPHSSEFTKYLKRWENNKDVSLVGIACVLNLIGGGYEMRALDIKSQCVFLNKASCKNHWSDSGVETDINIAQLRNIILN
jgi:hypothetical protein